MKVVNVVATMERQKHLRMNRVSNLGAVRTGQPLVVQRSLRRHSLSGFGLKHLLDPVLGLVGDSVPDLVRKAIVTGSNSFDEVVFVFAHEWRRASQYKVSDDTDGPKIARNVVRLTLDDLRSHEGKRATVRTQIDLLTLIIRVFTDTKVDELHANIFDFIRVETLDHDIV